MNRHSLRENRHDLARPGDAGASDRHQVSIHVFNLGRQAHQRLAEGDLQHDVQIVASSGELGVRQRLDVEDKVAGGVVRMLVALVLKHDFSAVRNAPLHHHVHDLITVLYLLALAVGTLATNGLAGAATVAALGLDLLHETRPDLVHLNCDSAALTLLALDHILVAGSAGSAALGAEDLVLELHWDGATKVDVPQADLQVEMDIIASFFLLILLLLLLEEGMATTETKMLKHVERVSATAALSRSLQTLFALRVIDATLFRIRQDFIRVGDFSEFFV